MVDKTDTDTLILDPNKHYSKCFNKRSGYTYVYEILENYWDKEKKQARNKRRLVGKIDPVTGEIIRTGKKKHKDVPVDYEALYKEAMKAIEKKDAENKTLSLRLQEAEKKISFINDTLINLIQITNHSS